MNNWKSSLKWQLNAFFSDKKMVKLKQGYIGVRFRPTLLMALADKGHVEKNNKDSIQKS